MNRTWTRVALLLTAVCLSLLAAAPKHADAACLLPFQCTTEGSIMYFQDGCCDIGAFGPTYLNRRYVCHSGCYQRTTSTICTNSPCL